MKKLKIAIVDDHQIFRKGLNLLLKEIDMVSEIDEAGNGREFLMLMKKKDFDVVFMDIKMPEMNGIEATRKALQKKPDLKIIAISMFGEVEYLYKMIEAGVAGFLLKTANKSQLSEAILKVHKGINYFSEELLKNINTSYSFSVSKNTRLKEETIKFTKREQEVLQLICKGLSTSEIAEILFLSQRTIDGHRANLMKKTGSKNTVSLVLYAIKNDLVEI